VLFRLICVVFEMPARSVIGSIIPGLTPSPDS
jgi:hypothetical protein